MVLRASRLLTLLRGARASIAELFGTSSRAILSGCVDCLEDTSVQVEVSVTDLVTISEFQSQF